MDNIPNTDINYCEKLWVEFTTLTEEEAAILNRITGYREFPAYIKTKIRCVDTGEIFNNVSEAARALNISRAAVQQGLKTYDGIYTTNSGITLERI